MIILQVGTQANQDLTQLSCHCFTLFGPPANSNQKLGAWAEALSVPWKAWLNGSRGASYSLFCFVLRATLISAIQTQSRKVELKKMGICTFTLWVYFIIYKVVISSETINIESLPFIINIQKALIQPRLKIDVHLRGELWLEKSNCMMRSVFNLNFLHDEAFEQI